MLHVIEVSPKINGFAQCLIFYSLTCEAVPAISEFFCETVKLMQPSTELSGQCRPTSEKLHLLNLLNSLVNFTETAEQTELFIRTVSNLAWGYIVVHGSP